MLTLLFVYLLSLINLSLADASSNGGLVSAFSRLLIQTADKNLGTNYTPPTPEQIAASVTDVNHSAMISTGLYTQTHVAEFTNRSYSYFLTQFGIDFSTGFVLANGVVVLEKYLNIPFASMYGTTLNVAFDSDRVAAGAAGGWYGFQFGDVIFCRNTTTFTSGLHAGETCGAGQVLTYIDWFLIKTDGGDISASQPREVFVVRSPWVSQNVLNSQGFVDSLSKLEIVDSNGNVGYFNENIIFIKDVATGVYYSKMRIIATWD